MWPPTKQDRKELRGRLQRASSTPTVDATLTSWPLSTTLGDARTVAVDQRIWQTGSTSAMPDAALVLVLTVCHMQSAKMNRCRSHLRVLDVGQICPHHHGLRIEHSERLRRMSLALLGQYAAVRESVDGPLFQFGIWEKKHQQWKYSLWENVCWHLNFWSYHEGRFSQQLKRLPRFLFDLPCCPPDFLTFRFF